jgi:prepilin-type processing-associated H-X9-DG protein
MAMSRGLKYSVVGIFALLVLSCMGGLAPAEFVVGLVFGWIFYLGRVLPEVYISPAGAATLVVCLVGVSFGSHAFLWWLVRAIRGPESTPWRAKWTAQLVAGILLMFVAGIAMTGVVHQTGWLITSPEPWVALNVQAARRSQSVNNLKQIGLGFSNYGRAENEFPPGMTMGEHGVLLHSWQTLILPFVEQSAIYNRIDLARPWDDPANAGPMGQEIGIYLIPFQRLAKDASGRGLSHYEGNVRVVGRLKGLRADDVKDGTSNTILAGESAGGYKPWGQPGHWRNPADGINRVPDRGIGSPWPGGANVLMLDGSVKFIKNTIDPAVLEALSTPAGGESLSTDAY